MAADAMETPLLQHRSAVTDSETLQLPVGPEQVKTFRSLEEVGDFITSERESFKWLTAASRNDWSTSHPPELANRVGKAYSDLTDRIKHIQESTESSKEINRVENEFRQHYKRGGLVYSRSPKGEFIENLREKEDDEYAALVYFYMTDVARSNRIKDLRAAFEANWYKFDSKRREESENQSLSHLRNEWEKRYESSLAEAESAIEDQVNSWSEQLSELKSTRDIAEQSISEKENLFSELFSEAEENLEELNTKYEDQIALSAPVKYWKDKADEHSKWSKLWGGVAGLAGVAAGVIFIWQAQSVLGAEGQPSYPKLIVLLTIASLGIWGLRLLVKLFTSHVTLQRDARERSVMLQSFLALLSEGHIDENEKDAVLSTLFRPAQDQSLSGDSTPSNAAGWFSKLISR